METLPDDEAHLWVVEPEAIVESSLVQRYEALLATTERDRWRRFRFDEHRHRFLVTRALVRTVLSSYSPTVHPRDWRFVSNRYGRPTIDQPSEARVLRFSLSRTRGLIACLVALNRELGVDVEDRGRLGELVEVADRYFSPAEARALRTLPREAQTDRFFLYWTLKESYIKARGLGLAIPLSQFSFDVDRGPSDIRISFDPQLEDDPAAWQFAVPSVGPRHAIAISLQRAPGRGRSTPARIRVRRTVPLR